MPADNNINENGLTYETNTKNRTQFRIEKKNELKFVENALFGSKIFCSIYAQIHAFLLFSFFLIMRFIFNIKNNPTHICWCDGVAVILFGLISNKIRFIIILFY